MSVAANTLSRNEAAADALEVRKVVSSAEIAAVSGTLSRAFFADPVLAWAFPDPHRRWRNLPAVFELYTEAFSRHGETYMTAQGTAATLWLPPATELLDEADEEAFAQQIQERAGVDADRLFDLMALLDTHHPPGDYYTLQLLAVEPQWQGNGVGSRLLETVLARCDAEQIPVYLEATSERNAALYERHGFNRIGEIPLPDGPSLYPMWRAPA